LDAHDLKRVLDGLGIAIDDTVRSELIDAYMTSNLPHVTMEDLVEIASGRKSSNGKVTADEYQKWAYRALAGGYQSPTWDEALVIAAKIKSETDRAPFVRKMLELAVDIVDIRKSAGVIKNLNASDATYIDILSGLMMSGNQGKQHAADIEHALELGDKVLAEAYRKSYPAELFKPEEEKANDTSSEVAEPTRGKRWKLNIRQLLGRKSEEQLEATAPAVAPVAQQPEKVAA
jgi:hypothetical protein